MERSFPKQKRCIFIEISIIKALEKSAFFIISDKIKGFIKAFSGASGTLFALSNIIIYAAEKQAVKLVSIRYKAYTLRTPETRFYRLFLFTCIIPFKNLLKRLRRCKKRFKMLFTVYTYIAA